MLFSRTARSILDGTIGLCDVLCVQPQPTPFDYVSSLSAEDRVVWCIDMMSALFTSRGSSILVSALSMGGGRVTARPASADLDTSLDSLGSSCELDSSMDSVQTLVVILICSHKHPACHGMHAFLCFCVCVCV